ncbi:MAG: hypothetical protein E7562_03835 [Ruminococcaceae bacterium]|nr:hypothetical protein [Oscillospiraceae bacterium]
MNYIYPDYYKDFNCIKGECRHNCCIGWEIDIDDNTLEFYKTVSGDFGEKLKNNIAFKEQPHFILGEKERCPFLNKKNLCDIIIELGEEHLCEICADHPRFRNQLPDRTEIGLGLSCEAAARLIIGKKTPMILIGNIETTDTIILLRDKILKVLQDRNKNVLERLKEMLYICNTDFDFDSIYIFFDILLSLERLDEEWTKTLTTLKLGFKNADFDGFDCFMEMRQTEYEQLAVYMLYRHFSNAFDEQSIIEKARFTAFTVLLIRSIGAVIWSKTQSFNFDDMIEIIRLFSAEIEYSDENLYILLDELGI